MEHKGTILDQPFPLNTSLGRKIFVAACFGVFVIGFLLLFKPFKFDTLEPARIIKYSLAYGAMTFVCICFMVILVPFIFPSFFNEERWTVGRQIFYTICNLFFIGLVNYLLSHFMLGSSLSFRNILWFQSITTAIGISPITIYILFQQNQRLKKYSEEASSLQQRIDEMNVAEPGKKKVTDEITVLDETITLKGDYQKEKISVPSGDLLYVTSASNYVKVYYLENNKMVYSILRITMKRIEDVLLAFPNFFRCHRAYLINLSRVKEVTGNAQGYKIKLEEVNELIPVSRNLNAEFSDKLLSRKFPVL